MKPRDLERLAALKDRMARAHREAAARRAAEAAAAREHAARDHFRLSIGRVTPLTGHERASLPRPAIEPLPRQRQLDEARALASTLSDELAVGSLLETDDGLSFRRDGIGADVPARLRRGQWSIQRQLDLHGLRRDAECQSLEWLDGGRWI